MVNKPLTVTHVELPRYGSLVQRFAMPEQCRISRLGVSLAAKREGGGIGRELCLVENKWVGLRNCSSRYRGCAVLVEPGVDDGLGLAGQRCCVAGFGRFHEDGRHARDRQRFAGPDDHGLLA